MENKIFTILAEHECSGTCYCWHPIPATYLSKRLGLSYYKTLKYLHKLRDNGLVEIQHFNTYDNYTDKYYIVTGWQVTNNGKEHPLYKEQDEIAVERINKIIEEVYD